MLLELALLSLPLVQEAQPEDAIHWRDIEEATVEGRAFDERAAPFDRLPASAEGVVRDPVWRLSRDSAGMAARFVTDAKEIHARWTLIDDGLDMHHMPATGVSGLDLYARDETGTWRWVMGRGPSGQETTARIVNGLDGRSREYMLYLPLYNGVESVEIGLPAGASFAAGPPRPEHRRGAIAFYGTSITHGACASRPGMTHAAILGRRLDRPIVNLGFSGNGRMEPEVAEILAEADAAVFVIDCLPNMSAEMVRERAAPFLRTLRSRRPLTPILLVEDRTFTNATFRAAARQAHAERRAALRAAYDEVSREHFGPWKQTGWRVGFLYLEGDRLLGLDGDGAVDSSHPNDLGFFRQADAFEPHLRELLGQREPYEVLLLGDSISMGYTQFVRDARALRGLARVTRANRGLFDRRPDNCAGTTKGVEHLDRWLAQDGGEWDVIHFNFGLHDLKRVKADTGQNSNDPADPRQAEPEVYERQLRAIVARLRETGAELVFATTTPVPEGGVKPHRDPADVERYNGIARRVMAENDIAINDLYAVVEASDGTWQRPVDVHFTREGSAALADQVVQAILRRISSSD